jgi:signal transduction histidine kinase
LRQSNASAGLAGIKDGESIRVIAAQGYPENGVEIPTDLASHDPAWLNRAFDSGKPEWRALSGADESQLDGSILPHAHSQILIPIQREAELIGLILLEFLVGEPLDEERMEFLSRLSDHAAIAISNAQLYSEVQAANLAKSEFVSFVSHELKTPMTSIKGFTDLLAAGSVGPVTEAQMNFLSTIRSNTERMVTLVSDLADISRIEAGRLRLDFTSVDVTEAVNEVIRSVHSQIETKEQILTIDIPDSLPPMWGDHFRIIQIITNLVSNAHKYTPKGGRIALQAELAQNIWDAQAVQQVIHLSVSDTGFGISPQEKSKIFQKFFRSEDQKIRDVPGTGLGLNITKTLVEMQGGQIWFESQPGEGTTFQFTIPVVETT